MAINFNTSRDFYKLLDSKFIDKNNGNYVMKPSEGKGYIQVYDLGEDSFFYYGEMNLNSPMLVGYNTPNISKEERIYSLTFKEVLNSHEHKNTDPKHNFDIAPEGITILSGAVNSRRLWLHNRNYRALVFVFSHKWIKSIGSFLGLEEDSWEYLDDNPILDIFIPTNSNLKQIIYQIFFKHQEIIDFAKLTYIRTKCFELVIASFSEYFRILEYKTNGKPGHPEDVNLILKLRDSIKNKPIDIPRVDDIANSMGMSKSKLQRIFKKTTGTSIHAYALNCRMEKSIELLMELNSVSNVAYELGYSTVGNFTSAFKEFYGFLPSDIK